MLQKTVAHSLFKRIKYGGIKVTYWDGSNHIYGTLKNPKLHVTIKDPSIVKAMMKNISLAVGEAYMDELLLIDGPLDEFFRFAYQNAEAFGVFEHSQLYKKFNKNIKKNQKKLVSYHYDLGNDFYEMWLDKETLGYTCSYYRKPTDTLEQGQVQKFDHILNKLQLKKNMELLEIGFGWGYLLVRAAKRFGIKGYGVSLSKEQLKFANALAKKEKVDHLVTFKLMNYQDLPNLKKQWDRVVSVGFLEHVGRGNHATYFSTVDKLLKIGGISVLHAITVNSELAMDAWADKYIFPGGYIPSIREITNLMPDFGFCLKDYENIGPHYVATLQEWWKRFEAHKDEIIAMYDERFYRMWRFWLGAAIGSFETGINGLSQWTFTKGYVADWPMTREYLYK